MKRVMVLLAMVLCFLTVPCFGEDINKNNLTATSEHDSSFTPLTQTWTISITDNGQLEINGKSVERMSDPELKATMLELRNYLIQQQQDRSLVNQYDRQTTYLLQELEKCQNKIKSVK